MIQQLHNIQVESGAIFEQSDTGITVPASFGNDAAAISASREGVALVDRSHWGLIQVSDDDRLRFLHNQSTNNFQQLQPGLGCDTVFPTSTARTIDLATAYVMEDAVLLLVSPNRRTQLMSWLDRYIFFSDKVKLTDVTDDTATFSLIGPTSNSLLENLTGETIITQPYGSHRLLKFGDWESGRSPLAPPRSQAGAWEREGGMSFRVAVGSGLATPGYTLIVPATQAGSLWNKLVAAGAVPMGDRIWEQLRIEQGRPAPDTELTEDYNPLEAGLWHTISFDKGCYIGQETIARLNTYKGVKQHLWGIRLSAGASPGTVLTVGEDKVGKLTSCTQTDTGFFGLAYVRTKAGGEGLKVQVGDVEGEIVDVPYLTRAPH